MYNMIQLSRKFVLHSWSFLSKSTYHLVSCPDMWSWEGCPLPPPFPPQFNTLTYS